MASQESQRRAREIVRELVETWGWTQEEWRDCEERIAAALDEAAQSKTHEKHNSDWPTEDEVFSELCRRAGEKDAPVDCDYNGAILETYRWLKARMQRGEK